MLVNVWRLKLIFWNWVVVIYTIMTKAMLFNKTEQEKIAWEQPMKRKTHSDIKHRANTVRERALGWRRTFLIFALADTGQGMGDGGNGFSDRVWNSMHCPHLRDSANEERLNKQINNTGEWIFKHKAWLFEYPHQFQLRIPTKFWNFHGKS